MQMPPGALDPVAFEFLQQPFGFGCAKLP